MGVMSEKMTICAIAKNEYRYIKDWAAYHLRIGFDKIVIYDNNDLNGERYDELLNEYIAKGQVEIRDRRGQQGQQRIVYKEYYDEGDFDWVCIIDIDEYVWFNETGKFSNIKDFVNSFPQEANWIVFNWKCYGDNNLVQYDDRPVYERFTEPMPFYTAHVRQLPILNIWVKSMYRSGLGITMTEHMPSDNPNNIEGVTVTNEPFKYFIKDFEIKEYYKVAYIKHFITKTVGEWVENKLYRGHAGQVGSDNDKLNETINFKANAGWSYNMDSFFSYNQITPEKESYLRDKGFDFHVIFRPSVFMCVYVNDETTIPNLEKYIDNINEVANVKVSYLVNNYNLNSINTFKKLYYYYSTLYYAYHDMSIFDNILFNAYNLSNKVNCMISVGYPVDNSPEAMQEYNNQLECLFGDVDKLRLMLRTVINSGNALVAKGSVDVCDMNLPYNDYKSYFKHHRDDTKYINNNIFLCDFKPVFENLHNQWLEFPMFENNELSESMDKYRLMQVCCESVFNNIIEVE